tara:strand:+ start:5393 stop:7477 length:2085 start_codon:yes stop_codon:yes gene_type:complete
MYKKNSQKYEIFDEFSSINSKKSQFIKKIEELFGKRIIDLFMHYPKEFIKRKLINEKVTSQHMVSYNLVSLDLKVLEIKFSYNKRMPTKIITRNNSKQIFNILYFNTSTRIINSIYSLGKIYRITGNLQDFLTHFQIIHPESVLKEESFEKFESIEPIYNLGRSSINKKKFRKLILNNRKFIKLLSTPVEWIDKNLINQNKWFDFKKSLYRIHFPNNEQSEKFRRRLAFDEILSNFLVISKLKKSKVSKKYYKINNFENSEKIMSNLDFKLTKCQKNAIFNIRNDLNSKRMFRLIQGDVGSGKTIVSALITADIINSGFQVAIMVPTDVLANQHFYYFKKLFNKINLSISLLTGKLSIKEKNNIYNKLELGKINLLIGTQSLFNKDIIFNSLGLIVIDEQHKFGVNQRLNLQKKNPNSHILIMSATPIPRSLTFAIYGEIDVSVIKNKPPGRQEIKTIVISNDKIEDLIQGLKRKIYKNEKIFWVVPEIGKDEINPKKQNIISRRRFLQKYFGQQMACIHGKMKKNEINEIIEKFRNENIMILLSTSLIEVGIDIPKASAIIIEHADKFGLAQLHQLRGRVGRGKIKSDCILLHHNDLSDRGLQRLVVMKNSNDGFFIAEQDLLIRGSGEIFGIKQTGLPSWKFFNPYKDMDFLEDVRLHSKKMAPDNFTNKKQKDFLTSIFFQNKQIENYFTG